MRESHFLDFIEDIACTCLMALRHTPQKTAEVSLRLFMQVWLFFCCIRRIPQRIITLIGTIFKVPE